MLFLHTESGAQRSAKAVGQWFSDAARKAGIDKGKSGHGLRKLRSIILTEGGASIIQRRAWLGHVDDKTSDHYARRADLKKIIGNV